MASKKKPGSIHSQKAAQKQHIVSMTSVNGAMNAKGHAGGIRILKPPKEAWKAEMC